MLDVFSLHQKLTHLIFNAFNLIEVPCLPIMKPSHLIDFSLSFLCTQSLVKTLVGSALCLTHSSLRGPLCHIVTLFVVCILVMVQTSILYSTLSYP